MNETTNQHIFTISAQWAFTIVVGAILTGAVSAAFGVTALLTTDHFTTLANASEIKTLQDTSVSKDVFDATQQVDKTEFLQIQNSLDQLRTDTRDIKLAVLKIAP